MLFDEVTDDFLVELNRTREKPMYLRVSGFRRVECQVVTLDTLRDDFPSQMSLARGFSVVAPPVISDDISS